MATPQSQPQPPAQQPIYPYDLNLALDRMYNKVTTYFDARFDKVITEIRVIQADIAEIKTEQRQMHGRVETLESFQKTMMEASKAQTADLLQVIQTLHAQVMESINELRPRDIE